jgi:hypothetical protein
MNGDSKKIQWSKFSPDRSEQFVIRTDTWEELIELKNKVIGVIPQSNAFPDDTGPVATPPEKVQASAKMCIIHNVEMKERKGKNGETFHSHARQTNNVWEYCNGRLGFPSEQLGSR